MSRSRPSNLNPLNLFFSAIFQREMTVSGRKWSTFLYRGGYALLLLSILSLAFLSLWSDGRRLGPALRLQQISSSAPTLALTLIWLQFIVLSLLATVLTADSICGERTARTLPTLLTTPLRPAQIVFSKLTSRMLQIIILILISLPVLLLIRVYGGLELEFILAGAVLTISTTAVAGSIALMFSIWHRRAWSVVVVCGPCMLLYFLGPAAVTGILTALSLPYVQTASIVTQFACPPFALGAALMGRPLFPGLPYDSTLVWILCALISFAIASILCLISTAVLRRTMLAEAHGWAPGRDSFISSLIPFRRAKKSTKSRERTSREIRGNPIMWRELRTPLLGTRSSNIIIGGIAVVALGLYYWRVDMANLGAHVIIVVVALLFQLLAAASITTGSIASEREARTLDVLYSTPVTSRQIIFGKLLGASRRLCVIPLFVLIHLTIFAALGHLHAHIPIMVPMIFIGATVFLAGLGLFWGSIFKRSITSVVFNFGTGIGLWLVYPAFAGIVTSIVMALTNATAINTFMEFAVGFINPGYLSVAAMTQVNDYSSENITIRFGGSELSVFEAVLLYSVITLCACGLGILFAHFGSRILERKRLRGR